MVKIIMKVSLYNGGGPSVFATCRCRCHCFHPAITGDLTRMGRVERRRQQRTLAGLCGGVRWHVDGYPTVISRGRFLCSSTASGGVYFRNFHVDNAFHHPRK